MEQFKKKLLKMSRSHAVGIIILSVLALLLLGVGISESNSDYADFEPDQGGYAKLDVVYLMGPFAEMTENGKTKEAYYIAEASDGYWYVIAEGASTKFPIYGEDVTDEDLDQLKGQTVYGKSTEIEKELVPYLVDFFSESDFGITKTNYAEYFGDHYLNTTVSAGGESAVFYIAAAVICFIAVCLGIASGKNKKLIKRKIEQLEDNGQLPYIYEAFASGQPIWSSKLRLAVSNQYILDFSAAKDGFYILPLANVNNVFKCNMINGEPTAMNYIALETTEGERYCIAPNSKVSADFYQIITHLKNSIDGGAQ